MKRILLTLSFGLLASAALRAQIPIIVTAADMPVLGDQLIHSICPPSAGLNFTNTGTNIAWDYSNLVPQWQRIDTYKTAVQAGYSSSSIPASAYGYKVEDSLTPPGAPVTLNDVYTFFSIKTSPPRFVAEGFAARVNGVLPVTAPYSDEDEWYFFPLTFGKYDSTSFKLTASVAGIGSLKQQGTRKTTVDGWGTMKTPYFTTPVPVLRVRSEVDEVDTISYLTMNFPIQRHYVDYKWLANGEHYPVLWISTSIVGSTETPTSVSYRDLRNVGIRTASRSMEALEVYPNPASGAEVRVKVPATWSHYVLHVYDATGKLITELTNTNSVNTASLPSGKYIIIAESDGVYGAAQFVR